MMDRFWQGKKVLVTGHTGFKGSWLCLWLQHLGADVAGYALEPPTDPGLFKLANVGRSMISVRGDIRDYHAIRNAVESFRPEIVFHLAAQALVRKSYQEPVETFATNVMGTVHLLEAVRHVDSVRVVVNVTSDKCYENKEWIWGYREDDPMGGYDPYSSSKGCAELATSAFYNSFFDAEISTKTVIASVRAGNVLGGGDWAEDRLVPDIIRAVLDQKPVVIRNPNAIRPWQHVLEPLQGYFLLAEKLYLHGNSFSGGWNFGPSDDDVVPVGELTQQIVSLWGDGATWVHDESRHPHEANYLKLDCTKARNQLGWKTKLPLSDAVNWLVEWYKAYFNRRDLRQVTLDQIERYIHC